MYRYLLFDLDDTLLDFKAAEASAVRQVLIQHGIDNSDETVTLYSAINDSLWKRLEKGEITRADIYETRFRMLRDQLRLSFDTAIVAADYFKNLSTRGYVFPETIPLLNTLKQKGYRMAAITNGSLAPQTGRITASGIGGYFNAGIYISEVIGYQKPQPEYFSFVLHQLGDPPKEEILVLGDSLSGDITGAIRMGIDSCYVNLHNKQVPEHLHPTYTVTRLLDIPTVCGL